MSFIFEVSIFKALNPTYIFRLPLILLAVTANLDKKHDDALTTFLNYGEVRPERQSEIFDSLRQPRVARENSDVKELAKAVLRLMNAQQVGDN